MTAILRLITAAALAWQAAVISADSAAKHVGETATVEGTVANVNPAEGGLAT